MSDIANTDPLAIQLRYIYNAYRTGLLNKKYYGKKLSDYQRYNFCMEIAIALGATGTGVAGLAIWGTVAGKPAWLLISGAAAVLSVVKPVLQYGKHIERYTKLYTGYTSAYLELRTIVEDVDMSKSITKKIEYRYDSIRKAIADLGGMDDPRQDTALIRQLQYDVNQEIPPESLWMP